MKNTFATEIILPSEPQRLEALRRYKIIGTYAESSFKSIAKLVAEIFQSSIAMISLVDDEEVYFGSNVGMDDTVGPRGESFCSLTVLKPDVNVIEDALKDPVVASNPLVCGDFGLRFYAGAPLITHDGCLIGTVCLVDTKPRKFDDHDRKVLEGLAKLVMEQIELRLQNLLDREQQVLANQQLAESNARINEFINVASHELRTPVTSLKAAMQIMDRMKENPKPEMMINMIAQSNKSLDKLTTLITDLLGSNRITQGQLNLRKTRFNFADVVDDCSEHIRVAGTHELVAEGLIDIELEADEQQIEQVMVNLVNNAVKYAPDSKKIYIATEQLPSELKITVRDTGPGIPEEQIKHLFERYYRADYSGYQYSGLGLGLYISSEIIKKHGGRIGVDSIVGTGTTFWFTLPLHLPE